MHSLSGCFPCERRVRRRADCSVHGMTCGPQMVPREAVPPLQDARSLLTLKRQVILYGNDGAELLNPLRTVF